MPAVTAETPADKPPVLLIETPAEGVRLLRLNRPEARNALNMPLRIALAQAIEAANADPALRAIVLAGEARVFTAGADIKERALLGAASKMASETERFRVANTVARSAKPIIAAVRGYCLGGGFETALMCDIVVAGEGAQFGLPELRLGVIPGSGGTQRFARGAGKHRALYHLLTATPMSAREALEMGVASVVVPDAKVEATAVAVAQKIAALAPLAVQQAKDVLLRGLDAPLEVGLALEARASQLLFGTEDQKEGMRAFIEKRPPRFQGR